MIFERDQVTINSKTQLFSHNVKVGVWGNGRGYSKRTSWCSGQWWCLWSREACTPELFILTFIRIYYLVYLTYSHLNLVDKLFCPIPHRIIVGWLGSCTFIRTTRFACGLGKVPRIRWWIQQSLGYKYLEHWVLSALVHSLAKTQLPIKRVPNWSH